VKLIKKEAVIEVAKVPMAYTIEFDDDELETLIRSVGFITANKFPRENRFSDSANLFSFYQTLKAIKYAST